MTKPLSVEELRERPTPNRCYGCGRFVGYRQPGTAWEACGQFGEETRYVCAACLEESGATQASNGSGDPRWCGVYRASLQSQEP